MAEGKNKIVVYADWIDNFEDLTDEELGKLMRHFFMYVNDMNPVLEDRLLMIAWKPIQATLKRDLKKWESFVDKQKANGKKGGRPKTQKTQALIEEPKKADSDSVRVSVTDKEIYIYSESDFLKNWGTLRKKFLKKETHINKLDTMERASFNIALKDFSKEDINHAMVGLFKQENKNIGSMYLRPKHFLDNVDKYLMAYKSKEFELYGKEYVKPSL